MFKHVQCKTYCSFSRSDHEYESCVRKCSPYYDSLFVPGLVGTAKFHCQKTHVKNFYFGQKTLTFLMNLGHY